jgi:hypothetical protein
MPEIKITIIQLKKQGVRENWNGTAYAVQRITGDDYIKIQSKGSRRR